MSRTGLVLRLGLLGLVFAVLAPLQVAAVRLDRPLAGRLPVAFHRLFLRLFGIRVTVRGVPPGRDEATLVLANHVSWLDVAVMSSLAPLSFIAKSEIAGWPLFGHLARLQGCVFVDRARRAATAEVNTLVGRRLARGHAIVLFPEGTTGDGMRLLPFRSSLVGAARAALAEPGLERIRLQPLAIAYVGRDGLPVTRREMPAIAWYGDMELGPHLAGFVRTGPLDVVVSWGEPIAFDLGTDRKRATAAAEGAVRLALQEVRSHPDATSASPRSTAAAYSLHPAPVVEGRAQPPSSPGCPRR